jgi:hypothetical protein
MKFKITWIDIKLLLVALHYTIRQTSDPEKLKKPIRDSGVCWVPTELYHKAQLRKWLSHDVPTTKGMSVLENLFRLASNTNPAVTAYSYRNFFSTAVCANQAIANGEVIRVPRRVFFDPPKVMTFVNYYPEEGLYVAEYISRFYVLHAHDLIGLSPWAELLEENTDEEETIPVSDDYADFYRAYVQGGGRFYLDD